MAHERADGMALPGKQPQLLFLGTSDSRGVPRLGCACPICRNARPGSRNFRTRAALLLVDGDHLILIDTPPELRLRLAEEGLALPNALFMTHPHDDHILGFSDAVKAIGLHRHFCPIYAPDEVFAGLRDRFGYLWHHSAGQNGLQQRPLQGAVTAGGWKIEAVRVNHGYNGWAYGYLIERDGWRCGYFPDALHVGDDVRRRWEGLDLLILGANFWQEAAPVERRSVYDVQEAVAEAEAAGVERLILTHLSHAIDFHAAARHLPAWASLAFDGRWVAATRRANPA